MNPLVSSIFVETIPCNSLLENEYCYWQHLYLANHLLIKSL